MGKGSKAPPAPDPYNTASAEAQFNRFNTYSPSGGGQRYGYTDASGNFVEGMAPDGFQSAVSYIESPWEQQIRQTLEPASLSLINRIFGDNIAGMPDAARVKDFNALADEIFNTSYERMKPGFEKENNRMLANLQARGLPVGGEAFNDAYKAQQEGVNSTLSDLALKAKMAAGGEQSRMFGLDSAARSNAISELVAAMGGGYNPPTSAPSGGGAGVNYSGLVGQKYQADMAKYNADQQNQAATMGTLGSLGAAMIMKSDRRTKTDVVALGRRGPLTAYAFRYVWDAADAVMRLGYMAQEVINHFPEAVTTIDGWMAVDYSKVPEVEHA